MSVFEVVSGEVRDVVRSGLIAGLRARGDVSGKLLDPRLAADPYPTYDWFRSQGRLIRTDRSAVTAHYDVCDGILRHPAIRTANHLRGEAPVVTTRMQRWLFGLPARQGLIDPVGKESMIGMDGPGHARLRRATRDAFSSRTIEALRPGLEETAQRLLAQARREPAFDLMPSFALALPVTAICDLLGIPASERALFRRWGGDIAQDLDVLTPASRQRATSRSLREMEKYFTALFARLKAEPSDGLLSRLLHDDSEDALTEREVLVLAFLLVLAGFETTVNLIGNGTMALIEHPDQWAVLREDPARIPAAVEELLRYDAPVQVVARMATEDVEIAGTHVPGGVMVSVLIAGANRDPQMFANPGRLDVSRPNARKHLSFVAGPHHCLGAALARLEGEIAFTTLATQLRDLRLAGTPRRRPTFVLRGYDSIPLRS